MFDRSLLLDPGQSFFLFGARGTGKTTLLRGRLPATVAAWVDLLDPTVERRLLRHPEDLLEIVGRAQSAGQSWVVIDEVQKAPKLLDVVHKALFEASLPGAAPIAFALTGSSARKLRRGAANLLAGRALTHVLHPLTAVELGAEFDLGAAMAWGTLPAVALLGSVRLRTRFLEAYCETYLKEEVFAEQLTRRLAPFRAFVEVAAQDNGHVLNYDKIGRDIGVDGKTVASYYGILEDTWLGFLLPPTGDSLRKKVRLKPKFYLFDTGVTRALGGILDVPLRPGTGLYGDTFEHFVIAEAWRRNSYSGAGFRLAYFGAHDGHEIDLVLEKPRRPAIFVEIKSTRTVESSDLAALRALRQDRPEARYLCLSQDPIERTVDGVEVLPWQVGLATIFPVAPPEEPPVFLPDVNVR